MEGAKKVGKVAAVGVLGDSVFEMVTDQNTVQAEELLSRNGHLDGSVHEITNVQFEKNVSIQEDGAAVEGVFPVFESNFDAVLPQDTYLMSDEVHICIANMQLYEAIQQNPSLAVELGLDEQAIQNLQSSVTPEGYDWHHHEEPGRMQIVNEEEHGMPYWGKVNMGWGIGVSVSGD